MGFADQYIRKQKGFKPFSPDQPSTNLRFAVVIPAFCEPHLDQSLDSLWNCTRTAGLVEVIIVVNSSVNAPQSIMDANRWMLDTAKDWISKHHDPAMRFMLIERTNMPVQDAGVGLARKTGMDEALYRFNLINRSNGFILSFDADSRCDISYFTAIEEALLKNRRIQGFSVYFEHPLAGNEFPEIYYRGITDYELHLRYMNCFLRFTGFPFAFHTVGSCFGVRADAYAQQGGMNKRKAGEDFYFLHKIIPLGHFVDITGTRVIPSPRASDRVPFGTGAAISKYLRSDKDYMLTYAPDLFLALHSLIQQVGKLYKAQPASVLFLIKQLPAPIQSYLLNTQAVDAIAEINNNSSSSSTFVKRFFRWFDAFRIIKYLNYASGGFIGQIPVREASARFLENTGMINRNRGLSAAELLKIFREIERGSCLR